MDVFFDVLSDATRKVSRQTTAAVVFNPAGKNTFERMEVTFRAEPFETSAGTANSMSWGNNMVNRLAETRSIIVRTRVRPGDYDLTETFDIGSSASAITAFNECRNA